MKIVVIGGTGLIGSKLVTRLQAKGHDVIAASPASVSGSSVAVGLRAFSRTASMWSGGTRRRTASRSCAAMSRMPGRR